MHALGIKQDGPRQCTNTGAALTTNHLLEKGEIWLHVSVNATPSNVQGLLVFPKSGERSFQKLRLIQTRKQSSCCSMTAPHSASTSIPVMLCSLSCQPGSAENGNQSKTGDQSTVRSPWSNGRSAFTNQNHEPAFGRVCRLSLYLFSNLQ